MKQLRTFKIIGVIAVLVVSIIFGNPVQAQLPVTDLITGGAASAAAALTGSQLGLESEEKVEKETGSEILSAVKVATANAFRYFMQKLAYDSAVYVASAGSGQQPLMATKSFGDYMADTATDAAGVAISSLGDAIGIDFCAPSQGPLLQASIQLGLANESNDDEGGTKDQQIKCTLNGMLNNFDEYFSRFESSSKAFDQIGVLFDPGGNDLGFVLKVHEKEVKVRNKAVEQAAEELRQGAGYLAQKTDIGKFIKTPGSFVSQEAFGLNSDKAKQAQQGEFQSMTAGDSLTYILANSAVTFANTLAQRGIKRLSDEGFAAIAGLFSSGGGSDDLYSPTGAGGFGGVAAAQLAYADLLTPQVATGGEFSLLAEFSACPQRNAGTNNCIVDQKFVSAVNFSQQGTPLTIKQAIEKNLIDGNWKLLPSNHELNAKTECRSSAFCYSNLVKLRRARIIPLGFELAAESSPKDNPWSLNQVLNGFNNCNTTGDLDADHPFCHLIDPNWVLKAPPTRCAARGTGESLLSSSGPTRSEYCADVQDCVATDDQGNCTGGWGYCLAEKNVWRLDADACPAQFAGCTVYTSRLGNAQGYIGSTIDTGICDATNVGCRKYLAYQVTGGEEKFHWMTQDETLTGNDSSEYLRGQNGAVIDTHNSTVLSAKVRFFNKNISTCSSQDDGCTGVVRADQSMLNIKLAPDYLGCYDVGVTANKRDIELPYSVEDAKKLASKAGCDRYASVCAEEEVGCKAYTPDNGGVLVTGIAKAGDSCASSCVGYNAYKQAVTNFEGTKFPVYAIPANAVQCTFDQAGCDEFTNLDSGAGGGEKKEYYKDMRICKKPGTGDGEATPTNFYTWEGSDTVGYQIKGYSLEAAEDGSPVYNTTDSAILQEYALSCNQTAYNSGTASLDCREIYNASDKIFYRLLSKTVTVSVDCHPLRKTKSREADCGMSGGVWNATSGFCIYKAIPSESASCTPQAAGCRVYEGPAKDIIYSQNAESGLDNWNGAEVSSESLTVGGHSLKVVSNPNNGYRYLIQSPAKAYISGDATYSVTFWAKGSGIFDVGIRDLSDSENPVEDSFIKSDVQVTEKTLINTWKQYRFGPITLPAKSDVLTGGAVPRFVPYFKGTGDSFYIDNFELTKGEFFAFVKDSSKIPLACDANPSDTIPGAALGCSLYTDQDNQKVSLRSFTNLCRPEAIGCELVKDTRNTKSKLTTHFNMSVLGTGGTQNDDSKDDIIIGPDRDLRVVVDKKSVCSSAAQGCRAFGVAVVNPAGGSAGSGTTYETSYLIDNPDKYSSILCQAAAEGCDAFSTKGNAVSYFKDPSATGRLCDYRENVPEEKSKIISSGWFKSGSTGNVACYDDYKLTGTTYGIWKSGDPAFNGQEGHYTGTCTNDFDQCFELVDHSSINTKGKPTSYYVIDNNKIDRSSCKGKVSREQGCALFEDARVANKAYSTTAAYAGSEAKFGAPVNASDFSIKNNEAAIANKYPEKPVGYEDIPEFQFRGHSTKCSSSLITALQDTAMVKSRYICEVLDSVLADTSANNPLNVSINGTTNGNNYITAVKLCENGRPKIKDPAVNSVPEAIVEDIWTDYVNECNARLNDANVVLKVRRDRECGEWLSCNSYTKVDAASADRQQQCTGLGLCSENKKTGSGNVQCTKWIKPEQATLYGKRLTPANYATRSVVYGAKELSGLSVGGNYTPAQYRIVPINKSSSILAAAFSDEYRLNYLGKADKCLGANKPDNSFCTIETTNDGRCKDGQCVVPLNGISWSEAAGSQANKISCRVFPESTAPFSNTIVDNWTGEAGYDPISYKVPEYSHANVCAKGSSCACSYQKLQYSGKSYYFDIGAHYPKGFCSGGFTKEGVSKKGWACGELSGNGVTAVTCEDARDAVTFGLRTHGEDLKLTDPDTSSDERREILLKTNPEDGTCQPRDPQVQQYRGLEGFCMEPDLRTRAYNAASKYACNSWYPIDSAPGITDIYNQYKKAGYEPPTDTGRFWCLASNGNMSATPNAFYDKFPGDYYVCKNGASSNGQFCSADTDCQFNAAGVALSGYTCHLPLESDANTKNAYTYNAASYTLPDVINLYIQRNQNAPQLSDLHGLNATMSENQITSTIIDLRDNEAFHSYEKQEIDGLILKPNLVNWSLGDMFLGNDNTVRCYVGNKKTAFGSVLNQTSLEKFCQDYARASGNAPLSIIERNGNDYWVGVTHRKILSGGAEDWVALAFHTDSFDIGNCGDKGIGRQPYKQLFNAMGNPYGVGTKYTTSNTEGLNSNLEGMFTSIPEDKFTSTGSFCDALGNDTHGCGEDGNEREFYGMRVHFGTAGKMEKMNNSICSGPDIERFPKWENMQFLFREQCTVIAEGATDIENYAFTQRLWEKQTSVPTQGLYDKDGGDGAKKILEGKGFNVTSLLYKEPYSIYGSFRITNVIANMAHYTYLRLKDDGKTDTKLTPEDQFINPGTDIVTQGASFGCPGGAVGEDDTGRCGEYQYNQNFKMNTNNPKNVFTNTFKRLFAKTLGVFQYQDKSNTYIPSDTWTKDLVPDIRATAGVPPTIAAIDESKQLEGGGYPIKKLGAFNVNGMYTSTSTNVGVGILPTTLRFAAWADTDQMPLKRMYIDWGDGTSKVGGSEAKYKNRKTYCSTSSEPIGYCGGPSLPNLTCTGTTQDEADAVCHNAGLTNSCHFTDSGFVFGNDPEACTQGFYEYQHQYTYDITCGTNNPNTDFSDTKTFPKKITMTHDLLTDDNAPLKDLLKQNVKIGDVACIFKPKVQVQDNWGWCNGSCQNGKNGILGCLDGDIVKSCDSTSNEGKGWTQYAGMVVVVEPKE